MEILDVRPIPPKERHPKIFMILDKLTPGQSFQLINDHDPKPLYYQIKAERSEMYDWTYLEEGPDVWQVKITRK